MRHVPAKEIGQTDSHATPEEGKRGMEIGVLGSLAEVLKLALEDDGNNDTVDGNGLAENDTANRTKISAYVLRQSTAQGVERFIPPIKLLKKRM